MSGLNTKPTPDPLGANTEIPDREKSAEQVTESPLDRRTTVWSLDAAYGRELGPPNQSRDILKQRLRFCGIVESVGGWAAYANLRPATVVSRIKRGVPQLEALMTKDTEGNHLRQLSTDEVRAEIKREYRRRSTTATIETKGKRVAYALIVADHRPLFLGSYLTLDEAVHAFNTAVRFLPDEWGEADQTPLADELTEQRQSEIEEQVRDRVNQHLQERVGDGMNVYDFPIGVSMTYRELLAPALAT